MVALAAAGDCAGRCCVTCGNRRQSRETSRQEDIDNVERYRCSTCRHFHSGRADVIVSTPMATTSNTASSRETNAGDVLPLARLATTIHAETLVSENVEKLSTVTSFPPPEQTETLVPLDLIVRNVSETAAVETLCNESPDQHVHIKQSVSQGTGDLGDDNENRSEYNNGSIHDSNCSGNGTTVDLVQNNELWETNDDRQEKLSTESRDSSFEIVCESECSKANNNLNVENQEAEELEPFLISNLEESVRHSNDALPCVELIVPKKKSVLRKHSSPDIRKSDKRNSFKALMHARPLSYAEKTASFDETTKTSCSIRPFSHSGNAKGTTTATKIPGTAVRLSSREDPLSIAVNLNEEEIEDLERKRLARLKKRRKRAVAGETVFHKELPVESEIGTEVCADDDVEEEAATAKPLLTTRRLRRKIAIPYKITQDGTKVNFLSDISKLHNCLKLIPSLTNHWVTFCCNPPVL